MQGDDYTLMDMPTLDIDPSVCPFRLLQIACPEALEGQKLVVCDDSMHVRGR